ncbi:SHS2 domain inserted in FtsA [Syntrophomonas zehnderi OL-4]|uniref:SHS2 domain inserted in FtsA n=1 Tax=Syntrophomonas zehnderi OL-4 TaxID=690567 RepID=A0A0E4C7L1_9FIRM|nr:cell division FtsA domain-containing protein [Syntrophomonas zehnderi]CFX03416.1 SHS2 domain inserted in FtsA [Syntrophomonas zehnderi OL-4]
MNNDTVFALDIGTRKIIGLVMQKNSSGYEVLDAEMIEHQSRAMLDGQIHDVEEVARTILTIKKTLEERLGMQLKSAAVAAAGRALKTASGTARKDNQFVTEMSRDEVRALEIEAVQLAQQTIARDDMEKGAETQYFCVGYSVIAYYLENQQIGNLIGQLGSFASVEVIATFLPRVVVDSLFSSLKHAGLEVHSITLEPIAALSMAIPPNMRLLNLALVDIGAGTSDIAIVKNSNIYAYDMVPSGGDELTEQLAGCFLMDFNSAEKLKRQLATQEILTFKDILDNQVEIKAAEIKAQLESRVRELAQEISNSILLLNGKATDAVLCVGGGSLTPDLVQYLAEALEIPKNRVGIRTRDSAPQVIGEFDCLQGPQAVTPLGIAYHSLIIPPLPFIKVMVNGRELGLWNIGDIDVADALLSAGISLNDAYGRPGMGKTIEVNGYLKVFKGEMGTAPQIRVNGKEASLDTPIIKNDQIEYIKGEDGENASVKLINIDSGASGYVFINGERLELKPEYTVNGQEWDAEEEIPDRSQVEIRRLSRLGDILLKAGLSESLLQEKTYNYYLNEQPMVVKWSPLELRVNGQPARVDQTVNFGASIEYRAGRERPRLKDLIVIQQDLDCVVTVNGEQVRIKNKGYSLTRNGYPVSPEEEIFNGARIKIDQEHSQAILSDIFKVIEIKTQANKRLRIRVDGEEGGYTTPLKNNSVVELEWE